MTIKFTNNNNANQVNLEVLERGDFFITSEYSEDAILYLLLDPIQNEEGEYCNAFNLTYEELEHIPETTPVEQVEVQLYVSKMT